MAESLIAENRSLLLLGLALLLGLLIGLQRGWQARELEAGQRVAGVRTHALVGLLGGLATLVAQATTIWFLPATLLSITLVSLTAFHARFGRIADYSITGMVGLLLTFCFGALALLEMPVVAAVAAVITALILDNRHEIHGFVRQLQEKELDAGLKLLVISVVVLPLLPNQGMGPGDALNPYRIWWLVVLIASISFVGYFAVRVAGAEKGLLFTSLFAGLSSSTALTLHFARLSRREPGLSGLLATGILIACGTMFPRILVYCALILPALLPTLLLPVLAMALLLFAPALVLWWRQRGNWTMERPELNWNPLDLKAALVFGALLTAILTLGSWLQEWLGDAGIYLLAGVSGITDVDAITLSLTQMASGQEPRIALSTAVLGIVIAASVNNTVKTLMAASVGTGSLTRQLALPMALSLGTGLAIAWLQ